MNIADLQLIIFILAKYEEDLMKNGREMSKRSWWENKKIKLEAQEPCISTGVSSTILQCYFSNYMKITQNKCRLNTLPHSEFKNLTEVKWK